MTAAAGNAEGPAMALRCHACGAESELEAAFVKVRRSFRLRRRAYCPACYARRHRSALGRWLIFYASCGGVGLALLASGRFTWLGLVLLNAFVLMLFCVLATVVHELGHALTAGMLGMRLFLVSIGRGKTLVERKLKGVSFVVNAIPFGGMTLAAQKSTRFYRLKALLLHVSGPLANVAMLAAVFLFVDWVGLMSIVGAGMTRTLAPGYMYVLACAATLAAGARPRRTYTEFGLVPNDLLNFIKAPFLSASEVQGGLASRFLLEALQCLKDKQYLASREWCERGLAEHPGNVFLQHTLGVTLTELGEVAKGRELYLALLATSGLEPQMRALSLNNLAWADCLLGDPNLLEEADRSSEEALRTAPWMPAFKGTRGSVLVDLERVDEGLALLRESMERADNPQSKALNACYLAMGEARKGNVAEARRCLDAARSLDPGCLLLDRASGRLAATSPT